MFKPLTGALALAGVLLLLPITARATCAWVFWQRAVFTQDKRDAAGLWIKTEVGTYPWYIVSAEHTKEACAEKVRGYAASHGGTLYANVPGTNLTTVRKEHLGGSFGHQWICLPDTIQRGLSSNGTDNWDVYLIHS
jgi:hypothetical protein